MQTTWIVIANASVARIYATQNKHSLHPLEPVKEFLHPQSRQKGMDLVTDRPGSYTSGSSNFDRFVAHTDPKEVEFEHFSQQIAHWLEKNYTTSQRQFDQLILAASPHFLGLLQQNIKKPLADSISHTIAKDYTHLDEQTLAHRLKEALE
jgi:protein required for attachment to host cells